MTAAVADLTSRNDASSLVTSWNVQLGATVSAGDRIIIVCSHASGTNKGVDTATHTTWVNNYGVWVSGTANFLTISELKSAVGNEGGANIAFTANAGGWWSAWVIRITAGTHDTAGSIEVSTLTTGNSTSPDSTTLTPAARRDWLYFSAIYWGYAIFGSTRTLSSSPSTYTASGASDPGGSGGQVATAVAYKSISDSASENPGAFTLSGATPWNAITFAVPNVKGNAPTPNGVTSTNFSGTQSTNHSYTQPGDIASGEKLVAAFGYVNLGGLTVTTPTGWTLKNTFLNSNSSAGVKVYERTADGTDAGAAVNFVTSGSVRGGLVFMRYLNGGAIEISSNAQASSTAPNSAALTPSGGDKSYDWVSVYVGNTSTAASAAPSNYTDLQTQNTTSFGMASARRALAASTEDPGAFTIGSSSAWAAITIAVPYQAASSPQTATPATRSVTITTYAPTIKHNIIVAKRSVTLTTYAPVIQHKITVAKRSLTLTTYAPTIINPQSAVPPTKAVTLTTFAPTVRVGVISTPAVRTVSLTTFTPTIRTPVTSTPPVRTLSLSTFAPLVRVGLIVVPAVRSLTLTTFAPIPHLDKGFPLRAAWYYGWYPQSWDQSGINPFTRYLPGPGYYDSGNTSLIDDHLDKLAYGKFNIAIVSWWSPTHWTHDNLLALLDRVTATGSNIKVAIYYEREGNLEDGVGPNPTAAEIASDLNFLKSEGVFDHPAFAYHGGVPMVFAYGDGSDDSEPVEANRPAKRWKDARDLLSFEIWVSLKVYPDWPDEVNQPDHWHQYGPAVRYDQQGSFSVAISAGFHRPDEASPRLDRDPAEFASSITDGIAANVEIMFFYFNEWGEGSAVELATGPAHQSDSFDRANGAIGTPDQGSDWSALTGSFNVLSNQARANSTGDSITVMETYTPDARVTVTLPTVGADQGIIFRASDVNNLLLLDAVGGTALQIWKRVSGTWSKIFDQAATVVNGDEIAIEFNGDALSVFHNGSQVYVTINDSFNQTATKHGMADFLTRGTFDDFDVYSLTTQGWESDSGYGVYLDLLHGDGMLSVEAIPSTRAITLTTYAPTVRTPVTATPATRTVSLTTFAPTVVAPVLATIAKRSVTLTTFAPTIQHKIVVPTCSVTLTTFAPTIRLSIFATPATYSLSLTTFAPNIQTPVLVTVAKRSVSLTTFAPTVSTPVLATIAKRSLTLTTFAPTVTASLTTTPATYALSLTTYAPTIINPYRIEVGVRSLILSTFAPTIRLSIISTPGKYSLSLTTFAPTILYSIRATIAVRTLSLTTFAPTVRTPQVVTVSTLSLSLTTYAPTILTPVLVTVAKRSLTLSTFAPTVSTPVTSTPTLRALTLTTFAPTILLPILSTPATYSLSLTTYIPSVSASAPGYVVPSTYSLTLTLLPVLILVAPLLPTTYPFVALFTASSATFRRLIIARREPGVVLSSSGGVGPAFRKINVTRP